MFVLLVFGGALSHPVEAVGQEGRRLKIVSAEMDSLAINDSVAFFQGMADPSGQLFLNGEEVKIYGTCVFAAPLYLQEGMNEFQVAHVLDHDTMQRRLVVVYQKPTRPSPTAGFAIEYTRLSPGGDLSLQPGDLLQVEMKATPGMQATFYKGIPLFEADSTETGVSGVYRGEYTLQPSDMLAAETLPFSLHDPKTKKVVRVENRQRLTVLNQAQFVGGQCGRPAWK